MKITRCKLSKKLQLKLLEFFVAEVTTRTSADLLGVQYNTDILFYHKIRLVIEYHLVLPKKPKNSLMARLNLMKVILAISVRASVVVVLVAKLLYSVF